MQKDWYFFQVTQNLPAMDEIFVSPNYVEVLISISRWRSFGGLVHKGGVLMKGIRVLWEETGQGRSLSLCVAERQLCWHQDTVKENGVYYTACTGTIQTPQSKVRVGFWGFRGSRFVEVVERRVLRPLEGLKTWPFVVRSIPKNLLGRSKSVQVSSLGDVLVLWVLVFGRGMRL